MPIREEMPCPFAACVADGGFVKVADKRESPIGPIPTSEFFTDRIFTERAPDPVPAVPVAETIEAEMQMANAFEEDLDVPAI